MPDPNFLPYTLQVIQPLKELFLQDRFLDIPEFNLNPNSDFNLISSSMASLAVTSSALEDSHAQTDKTFDAISEYIQDNTNLVRLQSLEYASKNFAATLENSYNTFHADIIPTVDKLRTRIESRYSELMIREKAEELLSSPTEPSESDYTFLSWDGYSSPLKQNEIIEAACLNAGISSPQLSLTNQGYVAQKMCYSSEFSDLKLQPEVSSTSLAKLVATFATATYGLTEAQISQTWDILTSKNSYQNYCSLAQSQMVASKTPALNAVNFISSVKAFETICRSTAELLSDVLSSETISTLQNNIAAFSKTVYAIQYYVLICKELRFKSKLILTKNIINQEAYSNFVQEGGSITDAHNYIKAFYLEDRAIPLDGIKTETVKSTEVAEKLAIVTAKLKYNATFIKSKCLISAYDTVMNQFGLETIASGDYPGVKAEIFKSTFLSYSKSRLNTLAGDIANLDNILYDVVIHSFHKNALVSVLHRYLNSSFDDLTQHATEDITDADINKAQCWATVDMLTTYLFEQLVQPNKK